MAGRSLFVCFIGFPSLRSPRCGRKKTSWKAKYKHGLIYYNTKKIYVSDYTATVHEFGHFLDKLLNFPAKHEVLFHIEAQAAASVLGDYAKTNSREYFAEYFSFWINNRSSMKKMARLETVSPQTYEYLSLLESNNWIAAPNR